MIRRGRSRASSETRPLRPEPDRDAAHRQRALGGREPRLRRLDAAADRRHRPGAERPGWGGGDRRGSPLARDRVGRRAGAPVRARGALPRGGRPARHDQARRRDARAGGRLGHLPARLGGRRHRLRDHARDSRERPPAERAAAREARAGARRRAARVRPPRADPRRGRQEAVEACGGGDGRVAPGRGHPRGGGARLPRGARAAEARRPPRPPARAAARDRGDRGDDGRGARGAGRGGSAVRAGDARGARSRRGAARTQTSCAHAEIGPTDDPETLVRYQGARRPAAQPICAAS